ncbi:MAG: RsmB/NOP family class I SAM-dependent RNA methyltransferase [Acuticoccus sp.]
MGAAAAPWTRRRARCAPSAAPSPRALELSAPGPDAAARPRRNGAGGRRNAGRPRGALGRDPRIAAARMVEAVCEERAPLSAVLDGAPDAALSPRDAALARAIVRTAVRRRGDIEYILAQLMAKPLPRKAGAVRAVLSTAAAQLLFMRQADHAAVNVAVDLLKADASTGGFARLANAVLRRLVRERDDLLAGLPVAANTPHWLYKRWSRTYGADAATAMAAIHREEPPLDLALAPGTAMPEGGEALPTGGVRMRPGPVEAIEGYEAGGWWVQDCAAQLPAMLLGDVAGQHILDLCAAPGGKTMQLAAAGARVTAVELDGARAERLAENLARTRLAGRVDVRVADARDIDGTFDGVLLDAPCSATGTLRRQPDAAWSKTPDDVTALAGVQRALIAHAATLVRPGGRLVYATCSLEREEGEAQLDFVRQELPDLELEPIVDGPAAAFAGPAGAMRTLPGLPVPGGADGLVGLDGFFAARFRRR